MNVGPAGSGAAPASYADVAPMPSDPVAPTDPQAIPSPYRGVAPAATFAVSTTAPDWAVVAGGVVLAGAAAWYAVKKGIFKRKRR
jgi:hypothetical protein